MPTTAISALGCNEGPCFATFVSAPFAALAMPLMPFVPLRPLLPLMPLVPSVCLASVPPCGGQLGATTQCPPECKAPSVMVHHTTNTATLRHNAASNHIPKRVASRQHRGWRTTIHHATTCANVYPSHAHIHNAPRVETSRPQQSDGSAWVLLVGHAVRFVYRRLIVCKIKRFVGWPACLFEQSTSVKCPTSSVAPTALMTDARQVWRNVSNHIQPPSSQHTHTHTLKPLTGAKDTVIGGALDGQAHSQQHGPKLGPACP